MTSTFFGMGGCKVCHRALDALFLAETMSGEFAPDIDIFFGHPRAKMLQGIFGPDESKFIVPVIVSDKPIVKSMFDSHMKSMGERIVIFSGDPSPKWLAGILNRVFGR